MKLNVMLAVLVALLVSGCASMRLDESTEKQIRNVAIVSLVPERANLERIGITVFGNDRIDFDVGGRITATIDETVARRIAAARPGWTVKRISYDRAALVKRVRGPGLVISFAEEKIERELADLARTNALDAMIVVTGRRFENQRGDGVGVVMGSRMTTVANAAVHANIDARIVGADGKVLVRGAFGTPEPPKGIKPAEYGLTYELKDNLRPEIVKRLSDAMAEQIVRSLNKRLDQLGLEARR